MKIPSPAIGLILCYSYLWSHEAARGMDEGIKNRPVMVLDIEGDPAKKPLVTVVPISHEPPKAGQVGFEVPPQTKERLKLDEKPSWFILSEGNKFEWSGPDIRPIKFGANTPEFGNAGSGLYNKANTNVQALTKAGKFKVVLRTDAPLEYKKS